MTQFGRYFESGGKIGPEAPAGYSRRTEGALALGASVCEVK
jgi:hypothetical protein